MYKIRTVHPVTNGKKSHPLSAEELIEAILAARSSLQEFQSSIASLLEMTRCGSSRTRERFKTLLQKSLASIMDASFDGKPLFDGHLDVDVVSAGKDTRIVRVRIADLNARFAKFHSNYPEITTCDVSAFARRMRASAAARTCPEASIQGVRLDTFIPRPVKSSRLLTINSLAGLTGLHARSYGNAIIANANSRDTGMPLADGCVRVNGIAVPASDGSVAGFVTQINAGRDQHGVYAEGRVGQPLVLLNFSAERIELKIGNQCGALLSGFPSGVTGSSAGSNGLVAWVSFRQLHEVRFDCPNTARLVSGLDAESVVLKSGLTANLSVDSLTDRRLALSVLQVMQAIVVRERRELADSLARLQKLLDDLQATQTRRNLATRANMPAGLGACNKN